MAKLLSFGEVLWDIIEGKEFIGGASLNLAAHLAKQGCSASILTRIGCDRLGDAALDEINRLGVQAHYVQRDVERLTGTAIVTLDENKVPSYHLPAGVAYQYIDVTEELLQDINKEQYDMFYFGTFIQRGPVSSEALYKILKTCHFKEIFLDVNIRLNFYPIDVIKQSLAYASIVKLNDDEVKLLASLLYGGMGEKEFIRCLFMDYRINIILVTKGGNGCTVYTQNESRDYNECISPAVDTVGAGDAFSAGFIHSYLESGDPFESTRKGNILGDFVASRPGAVPEYDDQLRLRLYKNG